MSVVVFCVSIYVFWYSFTFTVFHVMVLFEKLSVLCVISPAGFKPLIKWAFTLVLQVRGKQMTWHYLILILFFICCGVPVVWVGSRRLVLLIPDLQAVLFCGSMSPRLQTFMLVIWPCLSWSPKYSWSWNLHIYDRLDTGCGSDNVPIPSKTLRA